MNREVLISIINRGRIRFIPVRKCSSCDEYVGYRFVRMCDGSMIPVFSSGCRCCGINNGTLSERTWDEVLDLVKTVQNKPIDERTEEDEFILDSLIKGGIVYEMGDNKRRKVSYVRGVGIRRILREQSVSEDKDKEQISHNFF